MVEEIKEKSLESVPEQTGTMPEVATEAPSEQETARSVQTEAVAEPVVSPVTPTVNASAAPETPKDAEIVAIEKILSEDLAEVYQTMTPAAQQKFKARGEVVAEKIRTLVAGAKAHAHAVLRLIRDWLRLIPGVNRFFLEQEAKIKTDKILDYVETQKGEPLP